MSKSTAEIRQAFLDFFHSKGHQVVTSSSLVPTNDPTLLFTNAGMNQFKDVFLGLEQRLYSRATTSQRCVRAGGKHNDLENVGYTARHHTFFEMLGNFSFGDYFKRDAIQFAWELLTSKEWLNLPKEKLLVTVYASDDEAHDIWANEVGIPHDRIIRIGDNKGAPYASDNFWQMGDTGPCGPCTEIFYDHGDHIWGGPPGSAEEDGDRYIEIWNIVFMQFNRQLDGTMQPLPKPSVDTGMGLERISAVLQHVHANYEIDLFSSLIVKVAELTQAHDLNNKSLRVIADHIRACAFLIADGVMPSNENRGYVLRRIIRRAVRHGHMLGATDTFFYKLVAPLIDVMGSAAEELKQRQSMVEQVLKTEEEQFIRTLERGLALLDEELGKLDSKVLPGEVAFRLYDTFGFPIDLTADVCRERQIKVDHIVFEKEMESQRRRARESSNFGMDYNATIRTDAKSIFCGYDCTHRQQAKVIALFIDGKQVNEVHAGEKVLIILDNTPFYGESGGQVGDSGMLTSTTARFEVLDTQKVGQSVGHIGVLETGKIVVEDMLDAQVDDVRRESIRANHSATHLLHAALRQILGDHVTQKGSLVNEHSLRFDFSHTEAVTIEQLYCLESMINQQIRQNIAIDTEVMSLDSAKGKGAMALFGEKYDESVRVLTIGEFSTELCGGTHAKRTGDLGMFHILSESGTAAGIRRIEAVTGKATLDVLQQQSAMLRDISLVLKTDSSNLIDRVNQLIERSKSFEKEILHLKEKNAAGKTTKLLKEIENINGVNLLVAQLPDVEPAMLRTMVDELKNHLESGVIVLSTIYDKKVNLIVGVTANLTETFKAGELVSFVAKQVGGKGGGRADMAQAGGTDTERLPLALKSVKQWVEAKF